eukprot:m.61412 g.61412  ORF g.61412 m.61412 type:complete len:63 (+) comp35004_c0_seq7:1050-1238(+)
MSDTTATRSSFKRASCWENRISGLYLLVMTALQDAAQSHQTAGANARRDGHVCLDFSTAGAA